jgi:hypothetical protein
LAILGCDFMHGDPVEEDEWERKRKKKKKKKKKIDVCFEEGEPEKEKRGREKEDETDKILRFLCHSSATSVPPQLMYVINL